jgi:hypothetical protein
MHPTAIGKRIRNELSEVSAPADLEKMIRRWLVADDAFNLWFLETTKGKLDDQDLLDLMDGYGQDQEAVEAAWDLFRGKGDEGHLVATLETSLSKMDALMLKK